MSAVETDRTFTEVASRFAEWQERQQTSPLERAWRRLGWEIRYIKGLPFPAAVPIPESPVVLAFLPDWAETASGNVRGACFADIQDRWELSTLQGKDMRPWLDQLTREMLAIWSEDDSTAHA